METRFSVPQGSFELTRPGVGPRSPLRAWDSADEYVLGELPEQVGLRRLILNDAYGALAVALAGEETISISDSFVALTTARSNLALNRRDEPTMGSSVQPMPENLDLVIIKVPRTLSLLEHQLHQIRAACSPTTTIIGAGMTKNIHSSTVDLFERIIGSTTTSLAKKKARLIHPVFDPDLSPGDSPWPQEAELNVGPPHGEVRVSVQAGVFAGPKLDLGARVLLGALPSKAERVLDLGCGNGIIGTVLARQLGCHVTFLDESYLAIEAARSTFALQNLDSTADFVVGDAGAGLQSEQFDLVLNNPPFHESNAITDATAWRMFIEARRVLVAGGELRVVANRHLGYHVKLKRVFGNCETVSSTRKFVVLSCVAGGS